jgi:hypothetical protein
VGPLQAPIKKVLGRDKQKIKAWIKDSVETNIARPPEVLLRSFLSIGEHPTPDVLYASTIKEALNLKDMLRYAKSLCLSSQVIEASALFAAVRITFPERMSTPLPSREVETIVVNTKKWLQWVRSICGVLTAETEKDLLHLISVLVRKTASKRRQGKQNENTMISLLDIELDIGAHSSYSETTMSVIEEVSRFRKIAFVSFLDDILHDEKRSLLWDRILDQIPLHVMQFAKEGALDKIERMGKIACGSSEVESRFKSSLHEIWNEGPALLNEALQEYIRQAIGLARTASLNPMTFVDDSENALTHQMAAALLSSWEAREASSRANEAFRQLSTVARKFFNIRIGGEIGRVVEFNARVHEFPHQSAGEGRVRIVRPWVEWDDRSRTRVIIRAVVQKHVSDEERE